MRDRPIVMGPIVLNRLARETGSGARVQTALLNVQANRNQPAVMRDYAIQHLGLRYVDGYPDREASRKAFWECAEENFQTVGATSLLALLYYELTNKGCCLLKRHKGW